MDLSLEVVQKQPSRRHPRRPFRAA